jgi:hypothetical protein
VKNLLFLLAAVLFTATLVYAGMPAMPEIPLSLSEDVREPLIGKRQPLAQRKLALIEKGKALNQSCANVAKGSSQHQSCLIKQAQFNAEVQALRGDLDNLADAIDVAIAAHKERIIKSMNALARQLGWSADEQVRLDKALRGLDSDGDPATSAQIVQAWDDVLARGQDGSFARAAAQGAGPGFPGAGEQTRYQDCAVFALANAAGLPYGVAAARAAELIRQGEWRDAAARANPQSVIELHGLTGGEVVMLAEAFGQVEVVSSADFAKTLEEGRPLLVNVVPADGNVDRGHEVVLTKVFAHAGEDWYEMIDSNQSPQRRLYLSARELNTLLQEKGVAFRPEPGTVPKLFR